MPERGSEIHQLRGEIRRAKYFTRQGWLKKGKVKSFSIGRMCAATVFQPSEYGRQQRDRDNGENHQGEILFNEWNVAEKVTGQCQRYDPE